MSTTETNDTNQPAWHSMTWADVRRELTKAQAQINAAAQTTNTDGGVPADFLQALTVARRHLQVTVEVIDDPDEWHLEPADAHQVTESAQVVLAAVAAGAADSLMVGDYGAKVTATGAEHVGDLSTATPEELLEYAAHAIVSVALLHREAKEATERAAVALAMVADRDAFKAITHEGHPIAMTHESHPAAADEPVTG